MLYILGSMFDTHKINYIIKISGKLLISILTIISIFSCTTIKPQIDISSLKEINKYIIDNFNSCSKDNLEKFLFNENIVNSIEKSDLNSIKISPLTKWNLNREDIIQEKISFNSPFTYIDTNNHKDKAIFYFYRKKDRNNHKVILWIPGYGVSNLAFHFIKNFFKNELDNGYSVIFYNIPYHLERIKKGNKTGEGVFSGNIIYNLNFVKKSLEEIRTILFFLKTNGYTSISGWGGSLGASLLWLSSYQHKYNHLTLLIPVVDWNTVFFNPYLKEVVNKLKKNGISEKLIKKSYNNISPLYYKSKTLSKNIQILYSKFDQLTSENKTLEFAGKFKIKNIHGYNESHATILLNNNVYKDNLKFLERLDKN